MPTDDDAYESLIQFLYRAPIGLVQASLAGEIEMINPMSAQLLMPLSNDGGLDNLFTVLDRVAPTLRQLTADFVAPSGVVCESLRIPLVPATETGDAPRVLSISLLKLGSNRLMAVLSDVTQEIRREQIGLARRLNDASRTDALTRMPNRAVVLERIERALKAGADAADSSFAVLFINCDRFKQINDSLGHAAGDEVLRLMAGRLRSTLRQRGREADTAHGDALAARIGGDEFVVVLDDLARPDDVHSVALRLLSVLTQPYGIGSQQVHCSVSMGIVLQAQAAVDADAVLRDASIAMVESKRGGAGYVIFEPAMQERAARRGDMEIALRAALSDAQLFVVYQPVIGFRPDGATDWCAGVEALVRWMHPVRGVVSPLEFIGVAEESGLIGAIGEFVLSTACAQFVVWQEALGTLAPRTLAVNLSRAQLGEASFVETVARILGSSGMSPRQLQLEVTESLAAQDQGVQARLHQLKALGLTLALDDFGTGYSSLASLHLLPVDTVKIDRSFVSHADTSHHHRVLVETTVRVANSLGMNTVAEGIETEAQAAVIRQLGCDKGQGYLFSRPLPADRLVQWLTQAHRQLAA